MIEFFLIFTFIGFVIGKIFQKGNIAYFVLLLIPVVWAFEYGIFWAIVTYGELLFGVFLANVTGSRNTVIPAIHYDNSDENKNTYSVPYKTSKELNDNVISVKEIKSIIFILTKIAYCEDDVDGREIQKIITTLLLKLVNDLQLDDKQRDKAYMDIYMILPRQYEVQSTPILDYARELRFDNNYFKKEIVMGFITMFVMKSLPITDIRESLFKEVMNYIYPDRDMLIVSQELSKYFEKNREEFIV